MPSLENATPPLTVVLPARGGLPEVAPVLEAILPEARATGTEILVVGDTGDAVPPADEVVLLPTREEDIYVLRRRGIEQARGDVVAIGEDHAVPRPGWCEAVIRSHAEHPEAAAVVGCLVNATDSTLAGRANFLAFAAAWQPPMPDLPSRRPPPASALTFKREALREIGSHGNGWLEAELIPSLFSTGLMVVDERLVVDHYQDRGVLWSIRNGFDSARASYGYACAALPGWRRRMVARWTVGRIPRRLLEEAREGAGPGEAGPREAAVSVLIALAAGLGAAVGALRGPGPAPERVA